jgi:acyl carrier protein
VAEGQERDDHFEHTRVVDVARVEIRVPDGATRPDPVREFYHNDWVCDPSPITARTSWQPAVPLRAGFAATIAWYRQQGRLSREIAQNCHKLAQFVTSRAAPKLPHPGCSVGINPGRAALMPRVGPKMLKESTLTSVEQAAFQEVAKLLQPFRRHETPITRDTDITADLDLDSLAVMNLLMQVEEKFDISIPLNLIPEIRTVGDLVQVIGQLTEGA